LVLIALFGALALLLSAIRVCGLVSYSVVHSTPEIGVRAALGARPRDLFVVVLRQACRQLGSALVLD
jgi:ABC-type antimicrobial peptide transport system permease subunit